MPSFSKESLENIKTLHPKLQQILLEAIKFVDFKVICGYRGEEEQNEAFELGKSTKKWPNSKHNKMPSLAADVVPYFAGTPHIRWKEEASFHILNGILRGIGFMYGVTIRAGDDWDGDLDTKDQLFHDLNHIEMVLKEVDNAGSSTS